MNTEERAALIAGYREGPGVLEQALAGITPEELDRRPAPDQWSPREVVHHTADSEHPPSMHQRNAVAAFGLVHEVGRQEDGDPIIARKINERAPEGIAGDRIDARRRFVE